MEALQLQSTQIPSKSTANRTANLVTTTTVRTDQQYNVNSNTNVVVDRVDLSPVMQRQNDLAETAETSFTSN